MSCEFQPLHFCSSESPKYQLRGFKWLLNQRKQQDILLETDLWLVHWTSHDRWGWTVLLVWLLGPVLLTVFVNQRWISTEQISQCRFESWATPTSSWVTVETVGSGSDTLWGEGWKLRSSQDPKLQSTTKNRLVEPHKTIIINKIRLNLPLEIQNIYKKGQKCFIPSVSRMSGTVGHDGIWCDSPVLLTRSWASGRTQTEQQLSIIFLWPMKPSQNLPGPNTSQMGNQQRLSCVWRHSLVLSSRARQEVMSQMPGWAPPSWVFDEWKQNTDLEYFCSWFKEQWTGQKKLESKLRLQFVGSQTNKSSVCLGNLKNYSG